MLLSYLRPSLVTKPLDSRLDFSASWTESLGVGAACRMTPGLSRRSQYRWQSGEMYSAKFLPGLLSNKADMERLHSVLRLPSICILFSYRLYMHTGG